MTPPTLPPQLTREQAIAYANDTAWHDMTDTELAAFQLFQECLCVPFDRFHDAMESVLGRPVWTHEFANATRLREEFMQKYPERFV